MTTIIVGMRALLLFGVAAAVCFGGDPVFEQSQFRADSTDGWKLWSPREETAPKLGVDDVQFRTTGGSLMVSGASNIAARPPKTSRDPSGENTTS